MPATDRTREMIEDEARTRRAVTTQAAHQLTTLNIGAKNGATVTAVERGDGYQHQTVLTLASTPLQLNGGATNTIQYGGVKIYDFPEGLIQIDGCLAAVTIAMAGAMSAYFNNGTPEGDLSVGSSIADSAEALGSSDTSDDDMVGAFAFTMTDYAVAAAVKGLSDQVTAAALRQNGTATAVDGNLNAVVDADEMASIGAIILLVSGTIILNWRFCGDQ